MRASPRLLLIGLLVGLLALALPACGGRSAPPGEDVTVSLDGDVAPGEDGITGLDTQDPCSSLDEEACSRTAGCRRVACPGCNGEPGPFQCASVDRNPPCPDVTCIECREISGEAGCLTLPGCMPRICPACPDGQPEFFFDCVRDDQFSPPPCVCASECEQFSDTQSCEEGGCEALSCQDCTGQPAFESCYAPGTSAPACPEIECLDCQALDEAGCWEQNGCRADYCLGCGGNDVFTGCSLQGGKPTTCPALGCPTPVCDGLDETACQMATMCHAVYDFDGVYGRCATGTADCESPAYCMAPVAACPEGFRHLVRSGCYEGGCAPVPAECPAP